MDQMLRASPGLDVVSSHHGGPTTSTTVGDCWASVPHFNQKDLTKGNNQGGIFAVKTCKIRPVVQHPSFSVEHEHYGGGGCSMGQSDCYHSNGLDVSVIEGWSSNLGTCANNSCQPSTITGQTKLALQMDNRESGDLTITTSSNGSRPQDSSIIPQTTIAEDIIMFNPPDVIPQNDTCRSTPTRAGMPGVFTTSTRFPVWVKDQTCKSSPGHTQSNLQTTLLHNLQARLLSSITPPSPNTVSSSNRFNMLPPHQSAGMPSWHPKRQTDSHANDDLLHGPASFALTQRNQMPQDLRSIASGALVDIEIPSSFAGSSVSVAGSQLTLISSPHRSGSIRRSLSADSLYSFKAINADNKQRTMFPVGSSHEEVINEDLRSRLELQNNMRRASSLDRLPLVSPYPMPQVPCFEKRAKTPEMARSMSYEERASLAMSIDESFCRICWQGAESEECIQPCFCHSYVHLSCIQRWLSIAKITYCEVCRYQYQAKRKMKPMAQWRWWPNKNRHLAQLEATIILLGVVTPPLLCGIILCSQKIAEYLRTPDNAWKTAGLMTLVMVSAGTYLGAVLYFCHKFATVCRMWIESNRTTVVSVVPLTAAERRPIRKSASQVWTIS